MPGSKYERELRFIDTETIRLTAQLDALREDIPATPLDAEKKAVEIGLIEEQIAEYYTRRKEIEDSFIAAGLDVPCIERNLNANIYKEGGTYEGNSSITAAALYKQEQSIAQRDAEAAAPVAASGDVTAEIKSITDELMELEIKMLQAELAGDGDEKQKLTMAANALRSRRESLIEQMKAGKVAEAPAAVDEESKKRIDDLEADVRGLRSQISMVRSDVGEMRDLLRQIKEALHIDEDDF
ncbi:MAG: hypothetical protein IJ026_05955 [Candidatus Methanomethylophilaceae archaeon]|nr:hypothetical protein [Candidatus Methanomethylophilaceae archaeon]